MEKRWTTRARVSLPVSVSGSGAEEIGTHTRDLALGGVFVEFPKADVWQLDAPVELTFTLGSGGTATRHKVKAKVVRVTPEGAGMMFRDFDATTFRSLQELLRVTREAAAVQAHPA